MKLQLMVEATVKFDVFVEVPDDYEYDERPTEFSDGEFDQIYELIEGLTSEDWFDAFAAGPPDLEIDVSEFDDLEDGEQIHFRLNAEGRFQRT